MSHQGNAILAGAGVGLQGQGTDFVLTGPWEIFNLLVEYRITLI